MIKYKNNIFKSFFNKIKNIFCKPYIYTVNYQTIEQIEKQPNLLYNYSVPELKGILNYYNDQINQKKKYLS